MRRSISTTALLLTSVSAILGSGWLFAAYYTAEIAGPAALLSWLIGGVATIVIAFIFAELSAMLPIMGSSSRIPHYTHGTLVSFVFAWIIWLSYASLVPAEVQAVIQYVSFYFPHITKSSGQLTHQGYWVATALMLGTSILNIFSLRWLIRCNSFLTIIKIVIPIIMSLALLNFFLQPTNAIHPANSPFMPYGMKGVFAAIASGGIVFAFNGFKLACELAGEAKHPKKALPFAIIGSVILTLTLYLLLQSAFLSSIHLKNLVVGWSQLNLTGSNSPFSAIAVQENDAWLLPLIYIGAIVGPLAAALIYTGSASRSLYGTSKNGYIPKIFEILSEKGIPVPAIIANFIFGMMMFAPLPGWKNMITFLTSLMGVTYAIGPICLLALRDQIPNQPRPFKLPCVKLWTFLSFYICTLIIFWSGWYIISKLSIALLAGFIILLGYHFFSERGRRLEFHWAASLWLWPYFIGITVLSYYGSFGGGLNKMPFGWDLLIIAVFCIVIMWISQKFKLPAATTQQFISELKLEEA